MNSENVCLDLFAGLGGFSMAFRDAYDWRVVTVDIEEEFHPDICADVLSLTHQDLPDADVVLASPPCTAFTNGAKKAGDGEGHVRPDGTPVTDVGRQGIALAHHTVGIIRALNPDWWFLENPKGGMRNQLGKPEGEVWWCQYGSDRAKPTDLWGHHPPSFEYQRCMRSNPRCDHERAPRGSDAGTQSSDLSSAARAKIPYALSQAVLEAVENPEPEQQTLTEAVTP